MEQMTKQTDTLNTKSESLNDFKLINKEGFEMISRDSQDSVRETTDKPKISIPVILQEVGCVTNAARGNIESEDIKIWVPRSMKL
jgi:hypothetical protein